LVNVRQRWLQDGQEIADIVLDMDVQIGKSLPPTDETRGFVAAKSRILLEKNNRKYSVPNVTKTLPDGITSKEAYITRQMAKHPEVVEGLVANYHLKIVLKFLHRYLIFVLLCNTLCL